MIDYLAFVFLTSLFTNEGPADLKWENPEYYCRFSKRVDCLWQINGRTISLSTYNYSYINGNGKNTIHCNIKGGENASPLGQVQANPLPDSLTCVAYINNIIGTAVINQTIKIPCRSRQKSNCNWKKNNEIINMTSRFEYSGAKRGINTTDCSIKIKQFQEIDQGVWICLNDERYLGNYRLRIPNALDVIPESLLWKGHHMYSCNFGFKVNCQWIINGTTMSIESSDYNYIIGNGKRTSDCSIRGQENANPLPDPIQCFGIIDKQSIESNNIREELKWETKPHYQLSKSRHQYHCSISNIVESCTWQINGTTISMIDKLYHPAHYSYYRNFNRSETIGIYCIMVGYEEANQLPEDIKCVGIKERVLITTAINETVVLNCTSDEVVRCIWKKNNESIDESQRYEYGGVHGEIKSTNCSIKLKQVQEIDQGEWTCLRKEDCFRKEHCFNVKLLLTNIFSLRIKNHSLPLQKKLNVSSTNSTVEANILTNLSTTNCDWIIPATNEVTNYGSLPLQRNLDISSSYPTVETNTLTNISTTKCGCIIPAANEATIYALGGCLFAALMIIISVCMYIFWERKLIYCSSCKDQIITDNPNGRQNSSNTFDNQPLTTSNVSSNETSVGYVIPISSNRKDNLTEIHYKNVSFRYTKNTSVSANVDFATVPFEHQSSTTDHDRNSLLNPKNDKFTDSNNENLNENAHLYEPLRNIFR
ncbi:hypothetical protein CHUAL_007661 [Chamberlinius hualienensis]